MKESKINRRDFVRGAAAAGAGLALGGLLHARHSSANRSARDPTAIDEAIRDQKEGLISEVDAQATVEAYMVRSFGGSRVVHVHDPTATDWSGQTDYWNHVDQAAVDDMVDQGIETLTGRSSLGDAWQSLLPDYQSGKSIAIKLNFNNSSHCDDSDGQIDALIQPVNAVVRGLLLAGVAESDIWIYDAKRSIPDRFVAGASFSEIQYFAKVCRTQATFVSTDPNAHVSFSVPSGIPAPPATRISDVIINASYLINMPIMKNHGYTGVTLAFKNHFGTIDKPSPLHDYVGLTWQYYRSDYNLLVDLYRNPHIAGKTILTLADCLFSAKNGTTSAPSPWVSFSNQVPNSLLFSTDPVAIDCVMCDLLTEEISIPSGSDDYLRLARDAGLGVYERGDPWGSGYSQIDYVKIEL